MKLFSISILTFGLIMLSSSCEEKLDITNPNQLDAESFYKTETDAIASVNSIYSRTNDPGISRWMLFLGNTRSDLMTSLAANPLIANNFDQFISPDYNWGNFTIIWQALYVTIYRANQALDNIPAIEMDETLKARLIAEAKFLRGWSYYYLGLYWGNVPMLLKTSSPEDKPGNSTQAEVYAQVIKDLEEALVDLPRKSEYDDSDIGRATKGAAHAMLGKVQMMAGDYEAAADAFEWLVTGDGASDYDLVDNYRDNFLTATENNMESVWELQYEDNPAQTHGSDINNPDQLNYGSSIPPFNAPPDIGFRTTEFNRWVIWEFLEEETTSTSRDPRLDASFLYDSTDVRGPDFTIVYGQTWTQRYGSNVNARDGVFLRKFLNDAVQNNEDVSSPNNYRNIRYADVLLMYAECLNNIGRTSEAYQYVDRVRGRAGLPNLSVAYPEIGNDAGLFLEQLKHERITELAGESHRWGDLVRWGDLSSSLVSRDAGFANFENGKHELLPIPQNDIDLNPNIEQNPEW